MPAHRQRPQATGSSSSSEGDLHEQIEVGLHAAGTSLRRMLQSTPQVLTVARLLFARVRRLQLPRRQSVCRACPSTLWA